MSKSPSKKSYRELKIKLESILDEFESDEIDIDSALKLYEEAKVIMTEMEEYLKTAKNTVKKLSS